MSVFKAVALITGASSGIGLELAKIHAEKGGDLVLVARNFSKLMELKLELEQKYKVNIHLIGKDLSLPGAVAEVYEELKKLNIPVNYLINNAGFGDFGFFVDSQWQKQEQMIQLNIVALTHFTMLFAQEMVKNGKGKIMNVASTAAFQSGPTMAVYFATKAFVLSFSEAIQNELIEKGITVTTLCPGPTISGFQQAASMQNSRLFKSNNLPDAREIAEFGYKAMIKGDNIAVHGFMNNLLVKSVGFLPRNMVTKITRMILKKQ